MCCCCCFQIIAADATSTVSPPLLLPMYHRCCCCPPLHHRRCCCPQYITAAPNVSPPLLLPMYRRRLCCFQCVTSTLVSNVSPPGNCLRGCFRFVVTGAASGVVSPLLAAVINRVQMRDDSVIIIKNLKEKHTLPGKDIRCGRQSSGRNRLTLP